MKADNSGNRPLNNYVRCGTLVIRVASWDDVVILSIIFSGDTINYDVYVLWAFIW